METKGLMIARFEGGPYHGLTLIVQGDWGGISAMGLRPVMKDGQKFTPRPDMHELVVGQYVAQEKLEAQLRVFKWDGPVVEAPGVLVNTEPRVDDSDTFVERRTDGDRRAGHTMGRRSFRGDRRDRRERAVNWCELRRIKQRRDPKNQRREDR